MIQLCPECHHTPSGRFAGDYGAKCYCKCHDVADTAPALLDAIQNIIDAWDANDSHGVREEIERSRPVLDKAKGKTNV